MLLLDLPATARAAQAPAAPVGEPSPLALERNLALLAGAGAGKTYSLITLVLHLLAGARQAGPHLRPSRLCMVTFTDKAAAEMRARVRARLESLARGPLQPNQEPELRASLERLGRPFPPPEEWRSLREELGAASVGTFHSLCGQLLRRAPAGSGVDPAFEVLDEMEAQSLVLDSCERVVLDALESGDKLARELCQELTFSGSDFTEGLVGALASAYGKLREEGLRAAEATVASVEQARSELEALIAQAQALCVTVRELDAKGEWRTLREACESALQGMTPENLLQPERLFALQAAFLADGRKVSQLRKEPGLSVKQLYWLVFGKSDGSVTRLVDAYAAWHTAPFESTFRSLLEQVAQRHAEELRRRNALDFTALLIQARDLLRDDPDFRHQQQERLGALLVDEFQDTNRLQLELVLLLSERREGGPRPLRPGDDLVQALPLEPAFLCAVGDRKQSIYEFRGADVSVFSVLARKITEEGGRQDFLRHNRRSVPQLLGFFNNAFPGVLTAAEPPPRPYEVVYTPGEDDLEPVRHVPLEGPAVERLVLGEASSAADLRLQDAEAVARRLALMLHPLSLPCVAGEDGNLRQARGGDVAILLRTFTHLEVYRQALIRYGIAHRVLRGRGFYGAQEVLDLASLLALLGDAEDSLALAAVLRSPLVGLSDGSLFKLAGPEGLSLARVLQLELGALGLPGPELERLERFLAALPALRSERDRLGVRALLQVALEVTGYREALAGTPYAEQACANVDKLLALAARRDERGTGGCVALARELRRLADSDSLEAQADLLEAGDPRAVQILTIHRAKGLEWPVVVVPAMGSRRRASHGRALFERSQGLCLRPWLPEDMERYSSPRYERVKAELDRRETAEYRRLLYVALTRARDRLLLSGSGEQRTKGTWWQLLEARLEEGGLLRTLVEDVEAAGLPEPPPPPEVEPLDLATQAERVEAAVHRARERVEPALAEVVVEASALQDYVACPRRYQYLHRLGLHPAARPWEVPARPAPWVERGGWGPVRRPEEWLRVLLRELDWAQCSPRPKRRAHLEALLGSLGGDPEEEGMEAALGTVERWLDTAFARRLAASPQRVHRALPFALPLEEEGSGTWVEGEVDLVWESPEGAAWALVYVPGRRHPLGVAAHASRLAAVYQAMQGRVAEGVPLRVGVAFLGEPSPEPEWLPATERLEEASERLRAAGRALAEAQVQGQWPGREPETCRALGCGFSEHCYPPPLAC